MVLCRVPGHHTAFSPESLVWGAGGAQQEGLVYTIFRQFNGGSLEARGGTPEAERGGPGGPADEIFKGNRGGDVQVEPERLHPHGVGGG